MTSTATQITVAWQTEWAVVFTVPRNYTSSMLWDYINVNGKSMRMQEWLNNQAKTLLGANGNTRSFIHDGKLILVSYDVLVNIISEKLKTDKTVSLDYAAEVGMESSASARNIHKDIANRLPAYTFNQHGISVKSSNADFYKKKIKKGDECKQYLGMTQSEFEIEIGYRYMCYCINSLNQLFELQLDANYANRRAIQKGTIRLFIAAVGEKVARERLEKLTQEYTYWDGGNRIKVPKATVVDIILNRTREFWESQQHSRAFMEQYVVGLIEKYFTELFAPKSSTD